MQNLYFENRHTNWGLQRNWVNESNLSPAFNTLQAANARARNKLTQAVEDVGFDRAIELLVELSPSYHWLRGAFVSRPVQKHLDSELPILSKEERRQPGTARWVDRGVYPQLRALGPDKFIEHVYGDRIGRGFTRADLRHADFALYQALHKWLSDSNNQLTFELPSLADWNEANGKRSRRKRSGAEELNSPNI